MDNIKTWTGLPVEESVRMTEDRNKWRKYVHGVANPRIIEDGWRTEQYHRSAYMQWTTTAWLPVLIGERLTISSNVIRVLHDAGFDALQSQPLRCNWFTVNGESSFLFTSCGDWQHQSHTCTDFTARFHANLLTICTSLQTDNHANTSSLNF